MNYPNKNFRLSEEIIKWLFKKKKKGESWDKLFKEFKKNDDDKMRQLFKNIKDKSDS